MTKRPAPRDEDEFQLPERHETTYTVSGFNTPTYYPECICGWHGDATQSVEDLLQQNEAHRDAQ